MRRPLLIGAILFAMPCHVFAPCHAFGQGAVIESLEELRRGPPKPPSPSNRTLETPAPLPERVDLSAKLPAVRNQGRTDSCVSWAATYVAASVALRARGVGDAVTLSPSFTYNQVSRDQWCHRGTNASATLNLLRDVGALPIDEFAFDGGWCGRQPTAAELERAKQFRIKSWSAFDATAIDRVKQELVRGAPVIFSVRTTPKMLALRGDTVLQEDDVPGEGHSLVVVGYDDAKHAFRIQNSWGQSWADKGYGWFGYDFWKRNVRAGFVIE
jgi:C1A family cysteine protease